MGPQPRQGESELRPQTEAEAEEVRGYSEDEEATPAPTPEASRIPALRPSTEEEPEVVPEEVAEEMAQEKRPEEDQEEEEEEEELSRL